MSMIVQMDEEYPPNETNTASNIVNNANNGEIQKMNNEKLRSETVKPLNRDQGNLMR